MVASCSGVTARKGLWEVHYDPYDVTRIWVRNHHESGWIGCATGATRERNRQRPRREQFE